VLHGPVRLEGDMGLGASDVDADEDHVLRTSF
jgi:hypothetical protein